MAALLCGSLVKPGGARSLDRYMDGSEGAALLVDVRERRLLAIHRPDLAARAPLRPGSTLKPLVLEALIRLGRLGANETFFCPGGLTVSGERLNCAHPAPSAPFVVRTALAYSCNCFVAHFAARFGPGELASAYRRAGLAGLTGLFGDSEATGRVEPAASREASQLQALGEELVTATPAELAMAFRTMALRTSQPEMQPIVEGLEDAVEFGTARQAAIPGLAVAGKTGTVRRSGERLAWFAGFAPSRQPKVVVTVMLQGRSGGADAAPLAARILAAWKDGQF